jgi:hypothetical protein
MKPDEIDQLRAASLAATLAAARGRRIRRRAGFVALGAVAMAAAIVVSLRHPAPPVIDTNTIVVEQDSHSIPSTIGTTTVSPLAPPDPIIRTQNTTVARIHTPAQPSAARFKTDSGRRVERLDNDGLRRAFPGKNVAVIRSEGQPPEIILF